LRARGSLAAAEDILKRMLTLDPGNSYVLLLRGKAAVEGGDPKHAIEYLEKAADLDSHPDGLCDLLKSYLQIGNLTKAGPIAEKLLTVHNDPEGLFLLAEGSTRLGQYREALDVYTRHADRLLATDSAKLLGSLHTMVAHVRDDAGALDQLLLLLNKAGESTHVNEVTELLAHASVKNGDLARARDLYRMLATTEPQNQLHMQNYQQVIGRMEGAAPETGITAEEGAVIVEELEATAPVVDQSYPDHVAIAVRSAVTDADLFLSYNLPDKAVVPLLGALPQAPRDVRLNQRLAALHTRFQRFTEAAVCCRTLEGVYHDAGYPDEAMRYGELAMRYEQSAEAAPSSATFVAATSGMAPPAATAVPAIAAAPWPGKAPAELDHPAAGSAHPEFAVQEMAVEAPAGAHELSSFHDPFPANDPSSDLSSEWEHSLAVDETASAAKSPAPGQNAADASNPEIAETVEEVRFYLEHFMTDQARSGIEKLETLTSDASILDPLRAALASAGQPPAEPEPEIAEINADDPAEFEIDTQHRAEFATSPDLLSGYDHKPHDLNQPAIGFEPPSELAPELTQAATDPAAPVHAETSELNSFVADLEASLGDSFPQAAAAAAEAPAVAERALPGWPVAPPSKRSAAPAPAPAYEPEAEPVAEQEIEAPAVEVPPAPAAPAIAASAGSAAAAAPAMSYSPTPVRPLGDEAQSVQPAGSIDLSEMFGELKQELEEDVAAADDDPETHYNLGVAFREMGLLDEAIAELQKVCTALERGHAFAQPVQTYTWLAQCFLDKGVPAAAIRWYEKALTIPGLDEQARVAINYELGSACEAAQDKPSALRHFTDVYGANIDYRDVAERIQALKS
jgi:tetratricopeptide (TPR) repeat protein